MSFHNTRLPDFISIFMVGMPSFSTSIAKTNSGREIRSSDQQENLTKYIIKGCKLSEEQFSLFNGFFKSRFGQKFSFLLKDPTDHKIDKQIIGVGDGSANKFKLFKLYNDEISPFRKVIKRPIEKTAKIWLGNEEVALGFKIEFDEVIFEQIIPKDITVLVSLEFDLEVRFNQDNFEYSFGEDGSIAISEIEIIEI